MYTKTEIYHIYKSISYVVKYMCYSVCTFCIYCHCIRDKITIETHISLIELKHTFATKQ